MIITYMVCVGISLLVQVMFLFLQTKLIDKGFRKLVMVAYAGNLSCIPFVFYFLVQ